MLNVQVIKKGNIWMVLSRSGCVHYAGTDRQEADKVAARLTRFLKTSNSSSEPHKPTTNSHDQYQLPLIGMR